MTSPKSPMRPTDFDRSLSAWLDERAQPHAPTYLHGAVMAGVARTRPRSAWRVPERWIPVAISLRLAAVPRAVLLLMLLALLVASAVAGAALGQRLVVVNQSV